MNPLPGVEAFAAGARLAADRQLLKYTWLPALLSLAIIVGGFMFATSQIDAAAADLGNSLPQWLRFIEWLLLPIAYLVGIAVSAWAFGFVAIILASPFFGTLANAVERMVYGSSPAAEASPTLRESIAREARKLGYHLPRLLIVFILTLIPVVNACRSG